MITELNRVKEQLNSEPQAKAIKAVTAGADRFRYLSISWIEGTLDRLFEPWGWSVSNFQYQVISNEITCSLDLTVEFPNGQKVTRCGVASVPVQFDSKSGVQEWEKKKPKALVKNLPSVKATALKNACKSLGKILGRDISRKDEDIELFTAQESHEAFEMYKSALIKAETVMELNDIYANTHPQLLINPKAKNLFNERMDEISNLAIDQGQQQLQLDE